MSEWGAPSSSPAKDGIPPIVLKKSGFDRLLRRLVCRARGWRVVAASDEGHWRRSWDQLGKFAKVLGDGGEMELVAGAAGTA
jgi:hypothetical protein